MIAEHARRARMLGEQLGLPDARPRRARSAPTSGGTGSGWPGERRRATRSRSRRASRSSPSSSRSRTASAASTRRATMARSAVGQAVRPGARRRCSRDHAEEIFDGLDERRHLGRGDRRRAGARGRACRATVRRRARRDRRLRRPQVAVHARSLARRRRPRGGGRHSSSGSPDAEVRTLRRAGLVHGFGRLGVSNAIWDKRGPLGRRRVGAGPHAPVLHRAHAAAVAPRWRRSARSPCSTASASTARGYPRGLSGARDLAGRRGSWRAADAYQAMREPRPHRDARSTPPTPPRELRAEVRAGRLDGDAVEAVLERRRPPRAPPARRARPG